MRLSFEIKRKESERGTLGETLVTGHCILVTVDREKYKPVQIPAILKTSIQPYLVEEA